MSQSRRRDLRRTTADAPGRRTLRHSVESDAFRRGFEALTELAVAGVQITASVTEVGTGRSLLSIDDHLSVPTASIGKVLLLTELAARLTARDSSAHGLLERAAADSVTDSGLWQHLQAPVLPVADLAVLVASVSDNLATNVLLRRIGLEAVRARGESLGLSRTILLDMVRDFRGPDDAPHLSLGSAAELTAFFAGLSEGTVVDPTTSAQVLDWLSLGVDLSLVASAFGLDPLNHARPDHGLQLANKTGSDRGIRSEAGLLRGPNAHVAYAVTMRFNDDELRNRLAVLDGMRSVGTDILEYVY